MPFSDRYWFLQLLGAGVLLACAATLFVWVTFALLPLDQALPQRVTPAVAFALVAALGLLASAPFAAQLALRARDRAQRRTMAINGEQDRLPLAKSYPYSSGATLAVGEPQSLAGKLTLSFRATLLALLVGLLCCAGFTVSVLYATVIGYNTLIGDSDYLALFIGARLSPLALLTLFVVSMLGLLASSAGAWASLRAALYPTPFTITLDGEGLTWRIRHHQPVRLRWSEARLFEVANHDALAGPRRLYWLYSQRAAIRWVTSTVALASLPALIRAQTGLELRTLDPRLAALAPPAPADTPMPQPRRANGAMLYLGLALYQIVFTGVTLALPPSQLSSVNRTVVYLMTLSALMLLTLFVWSLLPAPQRSVFTETGQPFTEMIPLPQTPNDLNATYRFAARIPRHLRTRLLITGVALALDILPLAFWAVRYYVLDPAHGNGLGLPALVFGVVFGLPTLVGWLCLWYSRP
ncbi:MAG TPA: hypothetical protein VKQ36_16900, partial [Ktedonobacterales bacterium]|nr:hypothetical protein [Ktedonobacterales bacterium]